MYYNFVYIMWRDDDQNWWKHVVLNIFFSIAQKPPGGLGLLIFRGFTITHFLDTLHSVGLLWTRDQPVAETST
jgi:hypothetical protein